MTTTMVTLWIMAAAATATGAAQDPLPDWPERTIHFEKIDEPLETPISQFGSVVVRPQFAATIVVNQEIGGAKALDQYSRDRAQAASGGERFLKDTGVSELSEGQHKVMKIRKWMEAHSVRQQKIQPIIGGYGSALERERADRFQLYMNDGTYIYTIYGVTEEDARTLARAAVKRLDSATSALFEKFKVAILDARKKLEEDSARLKLLDREGAKLEAARKAASYSDDNEAADDMAELAKSLRAAEIEIAGIRAKMEAIDGFKARKTDDPSRSFLDRLTMEQDVNLAGALARKNALQRHHNTAQSFHDAFKAQWDAKRIRESMATAKSKIESWETQVLDPPDRSKPVVLIDDKIVIQPIKYTE